MRKFIEIFGWYGTVAILGAYALLSFGVIGADSLWYQALNGTGSIGILADTWSKRDYQPAVLNAIWTVIACIALVRILLRA